ncbi:hypothetical protein KSP9073_00795 [Kushneria phyllosphaerae]|uniref:Uncharacterized protein n=1 Tax=Kushneria phyllosphaerae TaxID=2100822 RepID=A0A2R8CJ74_9GAMM|nr:hypothetical protein KSP9073_00788 [Kushneria phyllosphaerae]SPJ32794.1 hypothetical protein KSP9073_00795 [Kushneria phyllosphaerae]
MAAAAAASVEDERIGPKAPRSSSLTEAEEAAVVTFRRTTHLPLDDCLFALQCFIPHLTRSSLHRLYQRHDISRLPRETGPNTKGLTLRAYPIGYLHLDICQVRTG